jgi:hypothetical protein
MRRSRRDGRQEPGTDYPLKEEELGVLGFEFSIAFEEGVWRAVAWKVREMEPEDTYPTLEEYRSAEGRTPLEAFRDLYQSLIERSVGSNPS